MNIVESLFNLLRDHCTAGDEGKEAFLQKVSDVVDGSTLRSRDANELWQALWEKPFYAGIKSSLATSGIETAKAAGVFDDYQALLSPDWDVTVVKQKLVAAGPRIQELIEQGALTGVCQVGFRLERVIDLARKLEGLVQLYNQAVAHIQENPSNSFAWAREQAQPFQDALKQVKGVGDTTALHIMTDLGFPVVKTDIWVCRLAVTFPSIRAAVLQKHGIDLALADDKQLNSSLGKCEPELFALFDQMVQGYEGQPAGITCDLDVMFRRYRFVDLMCAKFGMGQEASYGLNRSGVQALMTEPSLRQLYPELVEKAQALS